MSDIRNQVKKIAAIAIIACMVLGMIPAYAEEAFQDMEAAGFEEPLEYDEGDVPEEMMEEPVTDQENAFAGVEEVFAENVPESAEDVIPEATPAEETVAETVALEETVAETVALEETVAETVALEETVAESVALEETVAESVIPEAVPVEEAVEEAVAPEEAMAETITPEEAVAEPMAGAKMVVPETNPAASSQEPEVIPVPDDPPVPDDVEEEIWEEEETIESLEAEIQLFYGETLPDAINTQNYDIQVIRTGNSNYTYEVQFRWVENMGQTIDSYAGLTFSSNGKIRGTVNCEELGSYTIKRINIGVIVRDANGSLVESHTYTCSIRFLMTPVMGEIPADADTVNCDQEFLISVGQSRWIRFVAPVAAISLRKYSGFQDTTAPLVYDANGVRLQGSYGAYGDEAGEFCFWDYTLIPGNTYYVYLANGANEIAIFMLKTVTNVPTLEDGSLGIGAIARIASNVTRSWSGESVTQWDVYKVIYDREWELTGYSPYGWDYYTEGLDIIAPFNVHYDNPTLTCNFGTPVLNSKSNELSYDDTQVVLQDGEQHNKINYLFTIVDKNYVSTRTSRFTMEVYVPTGYTLSGGADGYLRVVGYGWQQIAGKWYYIDNSGSFAKGIKNISGKNYYFNRNTGALQAGWVQDGGKYYYFSKSDGTMKYGFLNDGGKYYYFSKTDGSLQTGFVKDGNTYYYFKKTNGTMQFGFVKDGGKYYYFSRSDGKMQFGFVKDSGKYYYFSKKDGSMQFGWVQDGSNHYYFDPESGVIHTGWLKYEGYYFYLNPSTGALVRNTTMTINGKTYQFNSYGVCIG